jgi:hypothetical protein
VSTAGTTPSIEPPGVDAQPPDAEARGRNPADDSGAAEVDRRSILERVRQPGLLVPLISGLGGLAIYSQTFMPGVGFGDWGEMATVPHILGVAHPTGYPTYILMAWLAELVPIGSVAFRANLLSAVYVAITLATLSLISLRLGVRPLLAVVGALTLGLIGTVWIAADVSEVNPLHLMFAALVIHRALVWADRRATRDLVLGGLLIGLALGNHLLMLFVAPFVVVYVLWAGRRELLARPWLLLAAGGAILVGLSVYLYIPLAAMQNPPLPYNHPTTLDGVIWLVSGTQFRGQFDFLAGAGPGDFMAALPNLWSLMLARATIVVPIVGAIGLARLLWRRPAFGLMCIGIMVTATYIWANYLELEHYLLVPWLVLGLGFSMGLEGLARALAWSVAAIGRAVGQARPDPVATRRTKLASGAVIGVLGLVFAITLGSLNWASNDLSANVSGPTYVDAVFRALPSNAAILSYWDASTPLWYGQHVEGLRPDVLIVDDTNIVYEGWGTREARIASLICSRPVFILRLDPRDLEPTQADYELDPFLAVNVAAGGPTAAAGAEIYQVHPRDAGTCPG